MAIETEPQVGEVKEKPKSASEEATRQLMQGIKSKVEQACLDKVEEREVTIIPEALVIGGGIAGMYASLDIADAGFKVHLVERSATIGGHMAQLDKTFPTLDCSACILTPRMVDVSKHANINLMSYAEVVGVEGSVGNFTVKVKQKPRYVIESLCTGCALCEQECRFAYKFPNEFDENLGKRGSIYRPFPQAIPAIYCIDPERCQMVKKGKCGKATIENVRAYLKEGKKDVELPPCIAICGPNAIDFDMKEEIVELHVGTIIVATGYDIIDPRTMPEYKYGVYPNVITGLEFERYSNASGPTFGKIIVKGVDRAPKSAVFISCVGSRNKQTGYEYCSRVCCMYLAKHAHLLGEKVPDCKITVLYQDVRAFGKGFEEFYDRVKKEGVNYRRGLASEIYQNPGSDRVIVRAEDTMLGEPFELEADIVVLGVGLKPSAGTDKILQMLGVAETSDHFAKEAHLKLRPVDTDVPGVFVTGCVQAPRDIPDSVAQGKAAASASLALLAGGKVKLRSPVSEMPEELCVGYTSLKAMADTVGAKKGR
jgi:heterodisulfide reductase subunit A